jgi:hypothetical protein
MKKTGQKSQRQASSLHDHRTQHQQPPPTFANSKPYVAEEDDVYTGSSSELIGDTFSSPFNKYSSYDYSRWRLGGLICVAFLLLALVVFIATDLGITVETKNELNSFSSSLSVRSGLNGMDGSNQLDIIKILLRQRDDEQCNLGYINSPYQTCVNKCNAEFCTGGEDGCSGGRCHSLADDGVAPTLESCVNGCACCSSYTICLEENSNDSERCMADLAESCSFEPYTFPPNIEPVCYGTKTTSVCQWIGVGFNTPVQCQASE